jgi:hypothetical protein
VPATSVFSLGLNSSLRLGLGLSLSAGLAGAQEWRSIESSRQLRGNEAATVRVEYGAGTVDLGATSDPVLYRMKLRYDAERTAPVASFDAAARSVTIGTRSAGTKGWRSGAKEGNTFRAELSGAVPMRLALELGATRGKLALGGLRLADLSLKAGASETTLDFNAANTEALGMFDLDVGAAHVTIQRGGNARARRVHVNIGAGELDYDLSGDWDGEVDLTANVAVGSMTLRVPLDAGVRVNAKTFLADFSKAGLEKRGSAWVSPGYDAAKRRVLVNVTAVLGGFEVVRR